MKNTFILWLFLRITTSLFAGIVSSIRPTELVEAAIRFFPPSTPITQWLNRVFISPWMRWDALWFERIVTHGYSAIDGTTQFHPLYPWLATPLAKLGVPPGLSLMIISALAGMALFLCFLNLAKLDLSPKDSFFALVAFSLAPPAFVIFAPYSEALFLLFSVLCLYFMRKKNWWLAGLTGCLATLTRQQGIFLLFPLAWELWESAGRNIKTLCKKWTDVLAISSVSLGLVIWMLYRAFILSDFTVRLTNFHEFIYSTIISPSASAVVPVQKFIWPWQALFYTFQKIQSNPDVDIWVNVIVGAFFLVTLAISWKKLRTSYRIYAILIALISFSYYTGPVHPYMGLPRHLFLAFPILISLPAVINKTWLRLVFVGVSTIGMSFLLGLYVLNAWVP